MWQKKTENTNNKETQKKTKLNKFFVYLVQSMFKSLFHLSLYIFRKVHLKGSLDNITFFKFFVIFIYKIDNIKNILQYLKESDAINQMHYV